jgi:hypothetical protein
MNAGMTMKKPSAYLLHCSIAVLFILVPLQRSGMAMEQIIMGRTAYIPLSHLELNREYRVAGSTDTLPEKSFDFNGFGFKVEYNRRYGRFCLSTGLEWDVLLGLNENSGIRIHYFIPDVSVKLFLIKNIDFYFGAGLAARVPVNKVQLGPINYDRHTDLWGRFILGYSYELIKGIVVNAEFNYDTVITFSQWSTGKRESDGAAVRVIPDYAYDVKLYIGVGRKI